jgi:hypothetical protein
MHSANFVDMPRKPATTSQKRAPGPPTETAMATWAMLPTPTVPEIAVVSAWKCVSSPGELASLKSPRTMRTAWRMPRRLMKRR